MLIDARSPAERWAESGRRGAERVQAFVRESPVGTVALVWLVALVVIIAAAVVKGDAEIGIGFTSEFVPVKGVKVVGALPREIEFVNEYSAYIPAKSTAADTAQALLTFLARPASRDIFKAAGVGM